MDEMGGIAQENSNRVEIDPDLVDFLSENPYYYTDTFRTMNLKKVKISWNWAGALFGAYWLAYRKLYGYCAGYCGISLISMFFPPVLSFLIDIALWVGTGLFGNALYQRYAEAEIRVGKKMEQDQKKFYFARKGGTSKKAVWVLAGILFLVGILKGVFLVLLP